MGISYLHDRPWSSWSRDERYFCSVLYGEAHADPAAFARWLIPAAGLKLQSDGDWDLGYEVCFYRDYLWQLGRKHTDFGVGGEPLPLKRTFDLCLFGENAIIVIEAKVCEAFDLAQNRDFHADIDRLRALPGLDGVEPSLVGLASSGYFENVRKFGRRSEDQGEPDAIRVFDGTVTWADIRTRYDNPLFSQADRMYGAKPLAFIEGEPSQ